VANQGQVQMHKDVRISSAGSVALSAASGITVSQVQAAGRTDLYSPAGTIQAAQAQAAAHVNAPVVSMYGYGQAWAGASAAQLLTVQAQSLQVSAPSGAAPRALAADGAVMYRLMDQGVPYMQLRLLGDQPGRVMVAASQLQSEQGQVSQAQAPRLWQVPPPAVYASSTSVSTVGIFLASKPASTPSVAPAPVLGLKLFTHDSQELLSDMSYGLAAPAPGLSLGLDSDLLRSTGQVLGASDWSAQIG